MNRYSCVFLMAVTLSCLIFPRTHAAATDDASSQNTISCTVLEAHMIPNLGVSVAVFHQMSKDEASRFSALMKEHSDTSVQFRTADGSWHKASVARLKSAFGRGLLLFASGSADLKERDGFVVKFE